MTERWPWPGDTPTERARRIANSLLALLPAEERPIWSARAHAFGETWLGENLVIYTADQAITGEQAAQLLAIPDYQIRRWACTPHPDDPTKPLLPRAGRVGRHQTYLVRNVLDAAAATRRARQRTPA